LIAPYVSFRKSIVSASSQKYDLVIAQRVLSEIDSDEARLDLIKLLWERTGKYLVLIESHLDDHFKALMRARDFILTMGTKFDRKTQQAYLSENKLLSNEIREMLSDKQAGQMEKYNFLKSVSPKLPSCKLIHF
jgi:ribosomal protein RSM22 (predicted rRNA methylase)